MEELNFKGEKLAEPHASFGDGLNHEMDISTKEVTWSKDNVDNKLLDDAYNFATDYILETKIPFAARGDIDETTSEPILYLDAAYEEARGPQTEDEDENSRSIRIPLVSREHIDWNFIKRDIIYLTDKYMKDNPVAPVRADMDMGEPHQAAA